jgi:hypothetical protein
MLSVVGSIPVKRRYWTCESETCELGGSYAADDVVGIKRGQSKALQKHLCRLGADGAFAKASEHVFEMLGVKISDETVRTIDEGHGTAMAKFQQKDETTQKAFQKAAGEVEFTVDAGKVNTREEGWKDLKIGVILKRESGKPALPTGWEKQRLPQATMVIAFAMIATSQMFRPSWRTRLRQLGVISCAAVHVLGDGAGWIWKSVNRVLTGCKQTLDIYHASQRVAKTARKIFGKGTAESKAAFERGRALLLEKGWQGVCQWVGELLAIPDESERERRRKYTDRAINYFSKHVKRLNYAEQLAAGRAIGSGAVEGEAKTLGLRLKARGARWRIANVPSMAGLVCVRHSAHWNAYWSLAA